VTLALALGVQRIAKRHALVKRLSAVETLGCTSVICTDKTGTLTQNEMTACGIWLPGQQLTATGVGYAPQGQLLDAGSGQPANPAGDLGQLLIAAGLCTDARLLPPSDQSARWTIIGDPTEAALLVAAAKAGIDLEAEAQTAPRVRELPFESRRKRMSTIHHLGARRVAYVKGAPSEVLALCGSVRLNGQVCALDDQRRAQVIGANDAYARAGLRVLAIAMRVLPDELTEYTAEAIECDLTLLGLIAMQDPPRPEVQAAVASCHRAGIRIIMITGDYGLTAESVARRIGIIRSPQPRIISGAELETLDDQALRAALRDEVIFARVAPEHKLRVVGALQALGEIVAVTGDGVNDAPALRKADIGVAMGMAGTDVTKEAADMILTDDNFASIVNAVEEGRAVYANIRKFATYVFNSNMPEAVPFIALLFSRGAIPLPLTVMQVLAVDLGTDMVPALGLGAELPERGVMDRPPRAQSEPLLTKRLLARALLWYGMIESLAAMAGYFFLNWLHGWPATPLAADGTIYRLATTMTLAGIVATQIGAVFGCRTERASIFTIGFFSNRLVLAGIASELVILGLLIYTPLLQTVFNTAPIGPREWLFAFAWTPIMFLADEARKALLRWRERRAIRR
jgi:magnesium-transporting ATPase (P-type)